MTQEQEQKAEKLSRLERAIAEVVSFDPDVIHALNDLRPKIDREKKRDVDANIRRLAETNYQELMAAYYNTRDELTPEEVAILESGIHEFKPLFVLGDKVFRTRSIISEMSRMADRLSLRAKMIIERKPEPDPTAVIIEAVRTEGAATRETVTGGFRGLLEKVGLIRKRATWPRVSLKAQNRAAVLWDGWPGVSLDTGRGGAKVDCFEYYKTELAGYKIESVEHFKAVIDAARK
jgi:hypothetical protein